MQALSLPFLRPMAPYATLVLRVIVGVIMAAHGWDKLSGGAEGVAGFFGSLGIPAPAIMAWVVIVVELVGGILILLGLTTRIWALLFAVVMLVAILTVKINIGLIGDGGCGMELDLALLAGVLAIAFLGPGALSLDRALHIE